MKFTIYDLRFTIELLALVAALTLGIIIGQLSVEHAERAWAANLIRAARFADGEYGAAQIRHAVIGPVTNIIIAPDHVAVFGRDGSRQWFPGR